MEPVAVLTLGLGALAVAGRIPLVIWPQPTVDFFSTWIAKPIRVRLLGLLFGAWGAGLVWTAPWVVAAHPTASETLTFLGWVLILIAGWMIGFPRGYQVLADAVLGGSDPMTLRVFGLLGTIVGLGLVWLGWEIRY